jgi:DNA-directed RNA polymerase specialized sigma24 family protein
MPANQFPKTSWSLIARALSPEGRVALKALLNAYWFPVYAFIRHGAASQDDACDRTQGFFARLVEKNDLAKVDRTRGKKFRSWLLGCVKHYLANQHKSNHAKKRDPGQPIESLDAAAAEGRYLAEPSHRLTPERLYDRAFAQSLLARVIEQLRAQYASTGKAPLFEALQGSLAAGAAQQPYEEVAARLEMTEGAVRKAAFDLRARYKKLLRAEVACLVDRPGDPRDPEAKAAVDEELRNLLAALSD